MPNNPVKDLPNLDLLRSFAVLYVVLGHLLTQYPAPVPPQISFLGITGVFIFFTHTCLVLMWSLQRKPHIVDFYIRRAFRIYPAAIVVILITVFFQLPALNADVKTGFQYIHPGALEILANLLLVHNIHFRPIVGVTWSLPLEVQMYILLPFLFFFVIRNMVLWPLLLLWCLTAVTVHAALGHTPSTNLVLCILYFLPGIMAYVGFNRWRARIPSGLFPFFQIGLTVALLTRASFYNAWFFCLVLGLSLPLFKQISSLKVRWIVQQIAKYSYGIYLTHTFANYLGIVVLRNHALALRLSVIVICICVFSALLYHLVEKPMIDLGVRIARRAERYYEHQLPV
jgi:peptidoglycan/LPS O-acetylase OafA/YrhL